ncbi:MAG: TetR/AcrR family transcriptional regulator [Sellimonas intestinalis]
MSGNGTKQASRGDGWPDPDVASRLFLEKGYEHTSIQDIINNLGGLSKGAIYHHFKSKEEILIAVTDRMTAESNSHVGTDSGCFRT